MTKEDAMIPVAPPQEWFTRPEPDAPTPLTVTDDGEVFGHLALWGACHTGFLNGALSECVKPPQSRTDYGRFHLGAIRTAEGTDVPVGKVTYQTGHAPLTAGLAAATRHYDNTGSVGAFVRAVDGRHGIWLTGALRNDITPEGVRDLRANPPSGDWRSFNGNLELIASLSVPVPGFQTPQLALAASGAGEVEALILPGYTEDHPAGDPRLLYKLLAAQLDPPRNSKRYIRRRALLADAAAPVWIQDPDVRVSFETCADVAEMTDEDYANLGRFVAEVAAEERKRTAAA
jgi:hypothetical protein